MATEQILLSSSSFDGMRETGGFGQPLHTLYPQIRAVLAGQLGVEVADLLAEPVVDRARGRIDWYAEGDPDRSPMALSDLPEEQRRPILTRIEEILGRGRELAERYAASGDVQRMQLSAILKAALGGAVETGVFLVEGRPVMTGWGFAPDRPWEMPVVLAQPTRSLPPAPDAIAPRDVAIPDIALPELATAPPAEPAPPPESPPPFPEARGESSLEPAPESPPGVATDAAPPALNPEASPQPDLPSPSPESSSPPAFTPIPGVVSETTGEPLFKPDPDPVMGAVERPAMAEAAPASPLRYVVVGSRYFWSVFTLAILLALGVAGWVWMKKPAWRPLADQPATSALAQAQHAETALRSRLESLLTQLAERRGQCRLPDGSVSVAPVMREPSDSRPPIPTQSTVAVTGGDRPLAALKAPVPGLAEAPVAETPAAVPGGDRTTALPAQIAVPDGAAVPETTIPTDRASGSLAASGRNSGDMPSGVAPAAPDRMTPGGAIPAAPTRAATSPETAATPSPVTSRSLSGAEFPARTLEELLTDRPAPPAAPLQQPSPMAPPVRAEPTVEERREFTNRLSAAGAATGEITVALLWNSPGDLDLVVRCPSGRRLDYQHTVECGGTLDVDANAVRDRLSNRPVENAFWPAGKAEPGSYEIAVRYAPRKDEQNPAETSFQVRLVRGGQESVFKGAIRPNATVPVTTFTVER